MKTKKCQILFPNLGYRRELLNSSLNQLLEFIFDNSLFPEFRLDSIAVYIQRRTNQDCDFHLSATYSALISFYNKLSQSINIPTLF